MSDFDFETEAAKLAPELKNKQPTANIDNFIFDARHTYSTANEEREALSKVVGFDIRHLDTLPDLCDATREAQAASLKAKDDDVDAPTKLARQEADALLAAVVRTGKYVYRKNESVLLQLGHIGDTGAMPDRVGDLERAGAFCKAYPEVITADPKIPDNVVARSKELATKLTGSEANSPTKQAMRRRNLAFWMLHEAVSEVRAAVRFRFPDRPDYVADVCKRFESVRRSPSSDEPTPPAADEPTPLTTDEPNPKPPKD